MAPRTTPKTTDDIQRINVKTKQKYQNKTYNNYPMQVTKDANSVNIVLEMLNK